MRHLHSWSAAKVGGSLIWLGHLDEAFTRLTNIHMLDPVCYKSMLHTAANALRFKTHTGLTETGRVSESDNDQDTLSFLALVKVHYSIQH